MKIRSVQNSSGVSSTRGELVRRSLWLRGLIVLGVGIVLAANAAPSFSRQPATTQKDTGSLTQDAKCVIGLDNIKPWAKGALVMLPTGLEFTSGKKRADIATSSIQDVFTGQESRQDVTGMGGTLVEAAIPYGGGRVVSLFSHKVDVLTVEYVDSSGGFHGAIFVLSADKALAVKDQLVAQGAKVTPHMQIPEPKERKQ